MTSSVENRPPHGINRYQPMPGAFAARSPSGGAAGFWRDGDELVLAHSGALPQRCVKCNRPAPLPLDASPLYWHRNWIYTLAIVNVLVYLMVALDVRKTAQIAVAVCDEHARARARALLLGWGGFASGLAAILYGIWEFDDAWIALGALTTVACSVVGLVRARIVYPTRIDDDHVHLRGCGRRFLDSLPELLRRSRASNSPRVAVNLVRDLQRMYPWAREVRHTAARQPAFYKQSVGTELLPIALLGSKKGLCGKSNPDGCAHSPIRALVAPHLDGQRCHGRHPGHSAARE